MIYILTKKSNGEAAYRKKFTGKYNTVENAEKWLKKYHEGWEEKYNLEIIACD